MLEVSILSLFEMIFGFSNLDIIKVYIKKMAKKWLNLNIFSEELFLVMSPFVIRVD